MSNDYIETCIQALPREEQDAAREAFAAVGENGDGTLIGKLLLVMRTNNAYAKGIPLQLKSVADSLVREMESIRSRDAAQRSADDEQHEKQFRQILANQMPALAKGLAVTRLAEGIEAQNTAMVRLAQNVSAMRHFRVGGVLLLMGLAALVGAGATGGFFYKPYNEGQQAKEWWDYFSRRGIGITTQETKNTVVVSVEGNEALLRATASRKNDQGRTMAVDLVFPK